MPTHRWFPRATFTLALPLALATAAGAMLWVVSHELIPASHKPGREAAGTAGLASGFAIMTMLAALL